MPVAAVLVLLAAPPATVRLDVDGAGCVDAARLRADVERLLGRSPFDDGAARLLRVSVDAAGRDRSLSLTLHDADGRPEGARTLASPDCAALSEAAALGIVLAVDPVRGLALETAPPTPPLRLELLAGPGAQAGAVPGVGFGGRLALRLRGGAWSAALEGWGVAPSSAPHGSGEVSSGLFAGAATGCAHFERWALCGVAAAGGQPSSGVGFDVERSDATLFAAAGLRGAVAFALGGWFVEPWMEALAPLTATRLRIGGDVAWRSWPVAPAAGAWIGRGL